MSPEGRVAGKRVWLARSERVRAARIDRGYTVKQLARGVGVEPRVIEHLEDGSANSRSQRDLIALVSGVLEVSELWLLYGDGDVPEPFGDSRLGDQNELLEQPGALEAMP